MTEEPGTLRGHRCSCRHHDCSWHIYISRAGEARMYEQLEKYGPNLTVIK